MRVDAHQHFWIFDPQAMRWVDETMHALRRDRLPGELQKELAFHGFDGSVAVQAKETLEETRFLLDLADAFPFVLGVVGWVDLRSPAVLAELDRFAIHPKFCGVRHVAQSEPDDFLLGSEFQRGIAALKRFDLTYDILIHERQLGAALELVKRFPEQRFVLDHLGKPRIRTRELEPWRTRLRELSRFSNAWCKLSGLVTEADHGTWQASDLLPYLDVALECFGPERLLFGSDWPVCLLAASYEDTFAVIDEFTSRLSEPHRRGIFGMNAVRAYRLSQSAGAPLRAN